MSKSFSTVFVLALLVAFLFSSAVGQSNCKCPDGSTPNFSVKPACAGGPPTGSGCPSPPPEIDVADNESPMPGMAGPARQSSSCTSTPCAAPLLGDIGLTTIAGITNTGKSLPVGENIYGPFENGFNSMQDDVLSQLGCATGKGYIGGGIDTKTAEQIVAQDCGVVLPRTDPTSNKYISLLDKCGGHTQEYHFHERLSCLYKLEGGHSTKVGEDISFKKGIYGKYENYATNTLPTLDACGGHFGVTPDSNGAVVYHYHLQDEAPFTVGCYGPNAQGKEVTIEECRALYSGCNTASNLIDVKTPNGTSKYQTWCPCFFPGNRSNVIVAQSYTQTAPTPTGGSNPTTPLGGSPSAAIQSAVILATLFLVLIALAVA